MTATKQQRGVQAQPLNVRIAPELIDWIRTYAREQGISVNMAVAQAIRTFQDSRI